MSQRKTTEEFVEEAVEVHGNKYDYSAVEYFSRAIKIKIFCNKHTEYFMQTPAKHLAGQGCPVCRYETCATKATSSIESFKERAQKVHGDLYDYSKSVYNGTHTLLIIICKKHNKAFEQKPTNHLSGKGCQDCADEKVAAHIRSLTLTKDEFVQKARVVHGDLYDYDDVVYERSAKKVDIWCNRHRGIFKQPPNNHLAGVGCPVCATHGYRGNRPGWLYVLFDGTHTKVGITNNEVKLRVGGINSKGKKSFKVVDKFYFEIGEHASLLETALLRDLRAIYPQPTEKFDGSTECFLELDAIELVRDIRARLPQDHKEINGTRPNIQYRETPTPSC